MPQRRVSEITFEMTKIRRLKVLALRNAPTECLHSYLHTEAKSAEASFKHSQHIIADMLCPDHRWHFRFLYKQKVSESSSTQPQDLKGSIA